MTVKGLFHYDRHTGKQVMEDGAGLSRHRLTLCFGKKMPP